MYETTQLNIWDSFNPRDLVIDGRAAAYGSLFMFGNRNVGNTTRTNLQVSAGAYHGESHVITNWYARTNIHTLPDEFHGFANSAIVTLDVGDRPRRQAPLADLLARKEEHVDPKTKGEARDESDALAENMYNEAIGYGVGPFWHALPDYERDRWRRISAVAHSMVAPQIMAFVPERQNYSVTITADRRSLGQLLEVLPTNVAPETLVWVHLEGIKRKVVP